MSETELRTVIVNALNEWLVAADHPEWAARLADPETDVAFAELDVDSLAAAEIAMTIEDETGYECDITDLNSHPTLMSLSRFLARQAATEEA